MSPYPTDVKAASFVEKCFKQSEDMGLPPHLRVSVGLNRFKQRDKAASRAFVGQRSRPQPFPIQQQWHDANDKAAEPDDIGSQIERGNAVGRNEEQKRGT